MEGKKYTHLFFDLDHTLWDFDSNARETLVELYHHYKLAEIGLHNPDVFIDTYTKNNHLLWAQYHTGKITKEQLRETRFKQTFLQLGVAPELLPHQFEEDYVTLCPTKKNLFPRTIEVLDYLSAKYTLHIITNGFHESSILKMYGSGLKPYFATVTCSELVGSNKPDPHIFETALAEANAQKQESIMIGDSLEADIAGAIAFGIDCIYFNPAKNEHKYPVTNEIYELYTLTNLL